MRFVVLRSTPVRAGQRFPEPLAPLSLVEYVAVWALKTPVPHTDVLKTHESQRVSSALRENKKISSKCMKRWLLGFFASGRKRKRLYHGCLTFLAQTLRFYSYVVSVLQIRKYQIDVFCLSIFSYLLSGSGTRSA